jgi:beta-1,4-mannosyl-glycoprotein beta-1,4-N-acetylglucosaminyltransferase
MKIYDCTTFYDENFILDLRFNVLDKYVDKFVITESAYSHSGNKKKFNFDISKFKKFEKKIIYIKIDNEPQNILYSIKNGIKTEDEKNIRQNSINRISYQRNMLYKGLIDAKDDDLILYSDNDEIPNLENFNKYNFKNEIFHFNQKLFYYKLNLFCNRYEWFGTKGCKKKNLINFDWLRNIKPKKYSFYRLDTFFSKTKNRNTVIINDGGWHFTQLKIPSKIYEKFNNDEEHYQYKKAGIKLSDIEDYVKRKVIIYDHKAKSSDFKFDKEFKLITVGIDEMPIYVKKNQALYKDWLVYE